MNKSIEQMLFLFVVWTMRESMWYRDIKFNIVCQVLLTGIYQMKLDMYTIVQECMALTNKKYS
jgi:hypothetical protein